jgi:hypothetical protein
VGIGADRSNRVVTVTATSGTLTRSATFRSSAPTLTASFTPLVVAGSTGNQIEYTLVDFNAIGHGDQPITVTAGLPTVSARPQRQVRLQYAHRPAPASSITASAAGDSRTQC